MLSQIPADTCHICPMERTVDGHVEKFTVLVCDPGTWPIVKTKLRDPKAWSTCRSGLLLVAVGPPALVDDPADGRGLRNGSDRVASFDN